jgi:hypothetical protein
MRRFLWLVLILLIFTACTPTTETAVSPQLQSETPVLPTATIPPPVIVEETSTVPKATAVTTPTTTTAVEVEPTAEVVVAETGVISGRTAEGAFFLGDPNAPITHIDYSDFL